MKNEKGITLVALIIMVAILLIIASVSLYSGRDSLDNVNLNNFYMQLEIVQKRVDDIASTNEKYIDEDGNDIDIKNAGQELNQNQKAKLIKILEANNIDSTNIIENFRYFTVQEIKDILDLTEIDYNLFINFEKRIIVAEKGITVEGISYHLLKNDMYFVEQDINKNEGTIKSLKFGKPIKYINDTYKVSVRPENTIGDLDETGYIKYKKTTSKYWDITNDGYIIMEIDKEYDVIFIDLNNNSIEKTIKIENKKDETGNLVKDENGNNVLIVREILTEESEEK